MQKQILILLLLHSLFTYSQDKKAIRSVEELILKNEIPVALNDTSKIGHSEMNLPTLKKYSKEILKTRELVKKGVFKPKIDSTVSLSKITVRLINTPETIARF